MPTRETQKSLQENISKHQAKWTKKQTVVFSTQELTAVKPRVGSILIRIDNKTSKRKYFTVLETSVQSKGLNRGSVNAIKLQPVLSINKGVVTYQNTEYPMILKINSQGRWVTRALLKKYQFYWNKVPQT